MVKRLTEHEAKKARERQTQVFEEDKRKKNKEKENKKKAIIKETLTNILNNNEKYKENCIKPSDFMKRIRGRRSSDSISSFQDCIHFEALASSRKAKSPEQEPRYYHL